MGKRNRRRRRRDADDDDELSNSDDGDGNTAQGCAAAHEPQLVQEKKWPTHFLGVRITDPEILHSVKQLQDRLVQRDKLLQSCCMPLQALHITICNLGLETPEQVDIATAFLQKSQADIESLLPKEPLCLEEMSNFDNQVLYVNICPLQGFLEFVDSVKVLVRQAGLEIRENHEKVVPHMTLLKVSYPVARQRNSWTVKPCFYSDFAERRFGFQSIDAIHLCAMGGQRREDGFYVCPCEIRFSRP